MPRILVLGLTAFIACFILTPLSRNVFLRAGLVDEPDSHRKFHLRAVPRLGGIPIALAYACALILCFYFKPSGHHLYIQHEQLFLALLPAGLIIFVTGLLDDLLGLRPWQKLAGQLAGSICAVALGAHLTVAHAPHWLTNVLSILWLIGCSNAVNLIDGMDGLATGVGLLATLTTAIFALLTGNTGLALASIPLAGCLLAFLCFNFTPASIFLGDCGSLTIGFALGCFGLIWSQHTGTVLGIVAPLMALALPLVDVALAIGRRFLRSVPIFSADRGHIHHKILSFGFSTRGAALLLYAVCALAASLSILESFSHWNLGWFVLLLFLTLVLVGINRLGYIEFAAARKTLSHRTVLRSVQEEIFLHELNNALLEAESLEAWWLTLREACDSMGFAYTRLDLDGRVFSHQFLPLAEQTTCRIQVGFGERGSLLLTRIREDETPRIVMAVLNSLQLSLEERTPFFSTLEDDRLPYSARTQAASIRASSTAA